MIETSVSHSFDMHFNVFMFTVTTIVKSQRSYLTHAGQFIPLLMRKVLSL
jgi:hypothetical protein